MDKRSKPKELMQIEQEIKNINQDVYDALLLSGGEVLLREDIFNIIKLANAYKFALYLETNGRVLAHEELVNELKKHGIKGFYVNFYSHESRLHNYIAGNKHAWKETVAGIQNLLSYGFDVIIKLVITKENYKQLAETIEFLSELGVTQLQLYFPESIPEEYTLLEELVPKIPEAVPFINQALLKMNELGIKLIPRETPFSKIFYQSKWVKHGKKTNTKQGHVLLYDNKVNFDKKPLVSVIIPTYNRSKILKNTIVSLFNQSFPKELFEVIVVDDGSTDDTLDMIKGLKPPFRLRYYLQDDLGYGPGRARNIGALYANGEILLFLDSDVISDPRNIEEHVKIHHEFKKKHNHEVVVIGKRIDLHKTKSADEALSPEVILNNFDRIKRLPARVDLRESFYKWCDDNPSEFKAPWHMIYTNNLSLRKQHYLDVGMIDESFVFWSIEDQELGYRMQWLRFVLNSRAIGYHQHHPLVYGSTEAKFKAFKYNARIFYKKFLNPQIYEMYKPWIHNKSCVVQINNETINNCIAYKFMGMKPDKQKTVSEIKQELELYAREGDKNLKLIGGNPLLHPKINEILQLAKQLFERITIETEAESLTELKKIIDISRLGVNSFVFMLGGYKAYQHDALMNSKGSFEAVLKAIKNMVVLNQNFSVKLLITKQNYPFVEDAVILLKRLGVKSIELNVPLCYSDSSMLFSESSIPLSSIIYYHIYMGLRTAKENNMNISTINVYSDFLGLHTNIFLRLFELFGKPVATSMSELR